MVILMVKLPNCVLLRTTEYLAASPVISAAFVIIYEKFAHMKLNFLNFRNNGMQAKLLDYISDFVWNTKCVEIYTVCWNTFHEFTPFYVSHNFTEKKLWLPWLLSRKYSQCSLATVWIYKVLQWGLSKTTCVQSIIEFLGVLSCWPCCRGPLNQGHLWLFQLGLAQARPSR